MLVRRLDVSASSLVLSLLVLVRRLDVSASLLVLLLWLSTVSIRDYRSVLGFRLIRSVVSLYTPSVSLTVEWLVVVGAVVALDVVCSGVVSCTLLEFDWALFMLMKIVWYDPRYALLPLAVE